MKAPDKIYIASYKGETFSSKWTREPIKWDEHVEYIRKDALLEWANEKLQESADRLDFRTNKAYAELVDKINSL